MVTLTAARPGPDRWLDVAATPVASRAARLAVCALVLAVPFEATTALVALPGQSISSAEVVLFAALATWAAACFTAFTAPTVRTPLTAPLLFLLLTWVAAALVAPSFVGNALRMCGRLGLAIAVYLLTVNGMRDARDTRRVCLAALAAGLVLGLLVLLDYTGVDLVRKALASFRPFVAHAGGQVRASGVFQYPTIASMYLEVLFALALPLLAAAVARASWWDAVVAALALLVMSQAIVLTFTRAGLVSLAASTLIAILIRYRTHGADLVVRVLVLLAAVVATQVMASRSLDALVLRFTTEGTGAWYSARIDAPDRIEVPTGGTRRVTLTVTNTGRHTWDSTLAQPFRLSYHWLTADGSRVVSWEGLRTLFPSPVAPGDRRTMVVEVDAPRVPGTYRVLWDVELETRLWFSTEPDAMLSWSTAEVIGPARGEIGPLGALPLPLQLGSARPGRLRLWSGAARMLADRPLTGVGPDNFRLLQGTYLSLPDPDPRMHSNSLYVEVLAGTGLLGGVSLAVLGIVTLRLWLAVLRRATGPQDDGALLASGIAAAAAAIALHGLVDSFLSFTATYVLFAIVLGLLVAASRPPLPHAHRV